MIYFLITKDLEYLGSKLDVLHRNYITWNCNLDDFVKKEYANIDTMKIDTMIIEQAALENSHALINLQNVFMDIKIICIIRNTNDLPELEKIQKIELVNYDENLEDSLRKSLNLKNQEENREEDERYKEPIRIGFLAEKRKDAAFSAISLVKALSEKDSRTCFCEISNPKKVILPEIADEYTLVDTGTKGVYQWNDIPFICNAGLEGIFYTVCSFCEEDHMERIYEQCDLQIWCESNEEGLLLHYGDRHVNLNISNPFIEDHREQFHKLLGSKFSFLMQEEKTETGTNELISGIQEEQKREQSKKIKSTIKKAGFLVILLFFMILMGFIVSIVFRNIRGREKKQNLKKEVQNEKLTTKETSQTTAQTTTETTTQATTETSTENKDVSNEKEATTSNKDKKENASVKKRPTEQAKVSTTTTHKSVITTRKQNKMTKPRNSVKKTTKKSKTSTQKKRTTTEKKKVTTQRKKVTTEKPKDHTEDFNVDYKVE